MLLERNDTIKIRYIKEKNFLKIFNDNGYNFTHDLSVIKQIEIFSTQLEFNHSSSSYVRSGFQREISRKYIACLMFTGTDIRFCANEINGSWSNREQRGNNVMRARARELCPGSCAPRGRAPASLTRNTIHEPRWSWWRVLHSAFVRMFAALTSAR